MPALVPIGPLAVAATFDHGTLTLRFGLGFPGFYAIVYISIGFPLRPGLSTSPFFFTLQTGCNCAGSGIIATT
ncbi:hypothetical protein MRS44_003968 [Fusarium solani]|uniref:uncharacterized protein n=1 Tax=Fusarium solani TaxID=169388 RepID=UPI0032C4A303|nr:hypothetical protein MRS44_018899 [Fusarium solani]KAJ3453731.1 hypothetical protein MRS44_017978 [Fusarium solani]KAJ3453734.1 hypothetical protein MRS44_018366 [Fusarium solani]KAJ3454084.1 hypothetical protein MRS44_018716 [Fusarium solani]KAJ3454087.1 hypothetical protein MRS44_017981 [Fusarium solani]